MNIMSISPTLTLLLLVASVVGTFLIKPGNFQNSRIYVFVSLMASVAVIMLSLNVLVGTANLEFQKNVTEVQFTKQAIDKLWLYPNQILTEKKKARPEFLGSLYYNNLDLYNATKNLHTKHTAESALEEQFISILFFQCWEDYLTIRKFDETGDVVWIVNFLQWAQSAYLKENFDRLMHNFAETTIKFGKLLFEYAKKIPIPCKTPDTYKNTAVELLKDQRMIALYKERSGS